MSILTEAGKDAVDQLQTTVERIEEEVRERIEDAINALDRWEPTIYDEIHGPEMDRTREGDYLNRVAVLEAVKRGTW